MATKRRLIATAMVLMLLCVVFLAGCHSATGRSTAMAAATEFLSAAAAGDVGRAQDVSAKKVTQSDLVSLRKALFGTEVTLEVKDLQLGEGSQTILGADDSTYFDLLAYTTSGVLHQPEFSASFQYEIAVAKHGNAWLVVSWTGPIGKVD